MLELLEESIIPRMFGTEIQDYHDRKKKYRKGSEKNKDPQQGIGSRNKNTKGKRNNGNNKRSQKRAALKKKQEMILQQQQETGKIPEKDVYFSFGEIIQLAYRRELLSSKGFTTQHTLFYKKDDLLSPSTSTGDDYFFDYRPKLSHRLLIWISKIDPQNKTNPDPPGVGFYRPEMIPISDLFREPKVNSDISDSDDSGN